MMTYRFKLLLVNVEQYFHI